MIKLIGAIIILFSVVVLSIIPLYYTQYRMRILRDFLQDFRLLHNELTSNLSSVPELIEFLSQKGGHTTRPAYISIHEELNMHAVALFHDDWCRSMKRYTKYLSSEEYNQLLTIGDILGKYILEEQLSAINNSICLFEESLSKEKSIYPEKKKLNLGIGTSLGMILVILLI